MTVGDIGTLLVVSSGSFVMTGTAKLLLQRVTTPLPAHTTITLTIQAGVYTDLNGTVYPAGTAATYAWLGTEFSADGVYNAWLQVLPTGGGQVTSRSSKPLIVGPLPTP